MHDVSANLAKSSKYTDHKMEFPRFLADNKLLPSFLTPMFLPILECFFVNILFQSRAEFVEEYQSRSATREQNKIFVRLPLPSAITEKCC